LAKRTGARILQASTSEVYGDPEVHPQPENYHGSVNPIGPRSCYDEGKRCAESLFVNYNLQNGVDIRIARIFNTYGPRMHPFDGRVVSNFILQALEDERITIYGDGSQTRSFCFVDDMVDALMSLMNVEPGIATPVNLGNPEELSVRDLAEKILVATGSRSRLEFQPLPKDDPTRRRPDIGLARALLSWSPTTSVDIGIRRTVEYFRKLDLEMYRPPTLNQVA